MEWRPAGQPSTDCNQGENQIWQGSTTTATWALRHTSWWWKEGGDRGQSMFIFEELAFQAGSRDYGMDGWDPLSGGTVESREKTDTIAQKVGSSASAGHVSQQ